jgi:hypothetical protein
LLLAKDKEKKEVKGKGRKKKKGREIKKIPGS